MNKSLKTLLLAACICTTSISGIMSASTTAYAYTQLIASVQKVSIFKDTLAVGESAQLELTWGNGAHPDVTYSSSDESVVTVDQDGIVTGIADGTATITVSYLEGKSNKTLDISVSSDVEKSVIYNTSELTLGDKVRKYDILHYDNNNKGSAANIVNTKGSYDLVYINEKDYVLPFDAEYVGDWGTYMYLAPDIEGITYLDARTLNVDDVIDRNTHLLCYDYYIKSSNSSNRMTYPVFLPKYYEEYIGNGEIRVSSIDHDSKTIELKSVPVSSDTSNMLYVDIVSNPYDTVIHGYDELDLTGLKLTINETDSNGNSISLLENVTIDEARKKYDVTVEIKDEVPGGGNCQIIITKNDAMISNTVSFSVTYGAPVVKGDINSDGELNIADAVLLQKWLLNVADTKLTDWNRADLCRDGILNAFDFCLLKKELTSQNQETKSIINGIRNGMTKDEVFAVIGKDYAYEKEKTTRKHSYYYIVQSGEVFDTNLEGKMFVEFDLETGLLVNYGYALGRLGTSDDRNYPYSEQQLKEAYDKIYAVMTDWYGESTKGNNSSPKAEYIWETDIGQIWAIYGVNLWSGYEPPTYEEGVNEIVLSCSVEDENNLWKPSSGNPADFADKAKVTVINRAVGVTGDGVESFIINLYRTAKNMVHGCPGN